MGAGFFGALLARAKRDPQHLAMVIYEGPFANELTQGALVAGARRWAGCLRARGARPGDVVLLSLPLSAALIEAFLGALWVGAVPSFMPYPSAKQDPSLFWSSHDQLFGRLGGGLVVTSPENGRAIAANITAAMVVVTPDEAAQAAVSDEPVHAWRGRDTACLQHSSGTTGLKKGVMLTFDAIEAQVAAYTHAIGIDETDTIVSWLPLYHDMGFVACLVMPLAIGATTVLLDPFAWLADPLSLLDAIARHRGAFAWLPNFAFAHLVNAAYDNERRVDLSSLRALIDCSEPCRAETLAAFERRFAGWGLRPGAVGTCYAMAETVFAVTQSPRDKPPRAVRLDRVALEEARVIEVGSGGGACVLSSGLPLAGVEVAILGEDLVPLEADRVGQIAISAPFLFAGYHLEPERTAVIFHDGFYLTGDLGFRLGDDIFVLGRCDDLLILLGRNVFAHQIEQLLDAVPGIKPGRVLAMGLDNAAIGSQDLVILAETNTDAPDPASMRTQIRQRLESILAIAPKKVVFLEKGWLVKSTSGKISRAQNRRKYLAQVSPARDIPASA